jgi:ABC-type glycerol-3-phosphate transport system substrate-binding protein
VTAAVAALAALLILAACAGDQGTKPGTANIDPASVSTTVTTEPDPARAGTPVHLVADISGVPAGDDTTVQFEIRTEGKANLIEAAEAGGRYRAEYTFPQAGTFHVYLHVYYLDLHITKLAKVEVT